MNLLIKIVFICLLILYSKGMLASNFDDLNVQLVGLLGKKVVLQVDTKQRIVAIGASSPEGIKVIAVNGEKVTLELNGQRDDYVLGEGKISTSFAQPDSITEQVFKDTVGMFRKVGSINGFPVNFLVDTGASSVALSSVEAKRLGIDYQKKGQLISVNTASGVTRGHKIKLKSVSLGRIKLSNIDAVVVDGPNPVEVLLGMSFLGRLKVEQQGEVMMLKTTY